MSDNIIPFPRDRQVRPISEEDVAYSLHNIQAVAIERVIDEVVDQALEMLCRAGYSITDHDGDDKVLQDHALIYDTFRSAIYRSHGIQHPLQKMAEDMFPDVGFDDKDDGEEIV